MIKCYKYLFVIYLLTAFLGFYIIGFSLINWGVFAALLGFVWIFLVALLMNFIAAKKLKRINDLLFVNFDPESYIQAYNKLLLKNRNSNFKIKDFLLLNLSVGYFAKGDIIEAKKIIDNLSTRFCSYKLNSQQYIGFLNCTAVLFLMVHDPYRAAEALNKLDEILKTEPRIKQKEKWLFVISANKVRLNIENSNYDNAEQTLNALLEKAQTTYDKVVLHFYLGLVYEHFSSVDKEKEAFEYVAQYGGALLAAKQARQKLENISIGEGNV